MSKEKSISISKLLLFIIVFLYSCEKSNNIVTSSFQSKEDYLKTRKTWVEKNNSFSFSGNLQLNKNEKIFSIVLLGIRKQLYQHYDTTSFFPPGRYFYKSQKYAKSTALFKILKNMPKGAIHHLHPTAMTRAEWIVKKAIQSENCYVFWEDDNKQYIKGTLHFFTKDQVPKGFQEAKILAQSEPEFSSELYDLLVFDTSINADSVNIWKEFENIFARTFKFIHYAPIYKDYHTAGFRELAEDGIQIAELRAGLSVPIYDLESGVENYSAETSIQYLQEAAAEIQKEYPDFTIQIIYTDLRFRLKQEICQSFETAFALRKKYPELIKGFDLVAEEDAGNSTLFFLDCWLEAEKLSKKYGIDMPFYFHDGESNWKLDNLYDALLLGTQRIGHGFNLMKFPLLRDIVKRNNICIEINPLSNQILGYVRDLRQHPAVSMLANGIPCSISSDDPSIFGYQGVTPDYWSIFLAWELSLRDLKQLAMNSILYSSLNQREKKKALEVWQEKWDKFISESIMKYNTD